MTKIKAEKSPGSPRKRFKQTGLYRNRQLLLMLIPGLIVLLLFKIGPICGMVIAFQNFSSVKGVFGSEFVGLANFKDIFNDSYMLRILKNTLLLALCTLAVSFPLPIIFSLFLNEVRVRKLKSTIQSLSFLPYFISSAVMVSILYNLLSPSTGLVNHILVALGQKPIAFMAEPGWFRPLYVLLQIWQTLGYSAVVYLAGITSIDPTLYEVAALDGASRWQMMWKITLPCISGSIIVMLIIAVGNIFTVDLDRILLMYNSSVYETADVIQTYVYRLGFSSNGFPRYSYGAAVNCVKSVIAFILVLITNRAAAKLSDNRLF